MPIFALFEIVERQYWCQGQASCRESSPRALLPVDDGDAPDDVRPLRAHRLALRLVPDATEDEKAAIAGELDDGDYDAPVYQPPPPPFTGDKPPAA